MLRFSANLGFLWPDRPLLARIEAAARAGFRAIEMHWPYAIAATEVKAACERHRLTLVGLNTALGDTTRGDFGLGALPGREQDFQATIDQSIAYCIASGATSIHAMAGVVGHDQRAAGRRTLLENLEVAS